MLAFLIFPVGFFTTFNTDTVQKLFSFGTAFGWFGLVAIIPYLILNIPIKGKKLSTSITSKVATSFTKTVATTGLNSIPYFSGEYYLEAESDILEMQSSNGIFEIFKNGRLLSIILTPLAMISLLNMPEGKYWTVRFLEYDLIFGRVDKLSMVFGYIYKS